MLFAIAGAALPGSEISRSMEPKPTCQPSKRTGPVTPREGCKQLPETFVAGGGAAPAAAPTHSRTPTLEICFTSLD
eukprot:4136487-Alexandrium_andersonii.AAC.1